MLTAGAGRFDVVLESENVAAWMAVNNAFTFAWGTPVTTKTPGRRDANRPESYWNGVLIQLGKFRCIEDDELLDGFKRIDFFSGKRRVGFLEPTDFQNGNIVWINIVNRGGRKDEPVPLAAFRERLKLGQIKGESFARANPLHHYLQPYPGGITIWNESGYTVRAEGRNGNGSLKHVRQTFTLEAPAQIEILRVTKENNPGPYWQRLTRLRRESPDEPQWDDCPGGRDALEQETHELERSRARIRWFDEEKIDRIVVTDPGVGGAGIGKNPPQSP